MEHLLYAREAMYRSCYEHPRKRAAERIFERLIRAVAQDDPGMIDDLYVLTDEELLCALRLVNLTSESARRLLELLITNSNSSFSMTFRRAAQTSQKRRVHGSKVRQKVGESQATLIAPRNGRTRLLAIPSALSAPFKSR